MSSYPSGKEIEYLRLRLEGVADAASRGRWAFGAISIVCAVQLALWWNFYLSWIRGFVKQKVGGAQAVKATCGIKDGLHCELGGAFSNGALKNLHDTTITEWSKASYSNLPLIGSPVHVSDLGIVGGLVLLVLLTWKVFSLRRENHLIEDLFVETSLKFKRYKTFVFFGVINEQLFATVSADEPKWILAGINEPVDESKKEEKLEERRQIRAELESSVFSQLEKLALKPHDWRIAFKPCSWRKSKSPEPIKNASEKHAIDKRMLGKRSRIARSILMFSSLLPVITLMLILAGDVWSLNHPSVHRLDQVPLRELVTIADYGPRLLVAAFFVWLVCRLTVLGFQYQRATVDLLEAAYDMGWDIMDYRSTDEDAAAHV